MPQLIVTSPQGDVHEINADANTTAMVAIRDAGVDGLLALCGGLCSCATCHVYVAPECAGMLDDMSDDENELLDGSIRRTEHSRLSCQILMTQARSGLRVTIADED